MECLYCEYFKNLNEVIFSFRFSPQQEYLPILYLDELSNRIRDLVVSLESTSEIGINSQILCFKISFF